MLPLSVIGAVHQESDATPAPLAICNPINGCAIASNRMPGNTTIGLT
jgi:hypothetical protein